MLTPAVQPNNASLTRHLVFPGLKEFAPLFKVPGFDTHAEN